MMVSIYLQQREMLITQKMPHDKPLTLFMEKFLYVYQNLGIYNTY